MDREFIVKEVRMNNVKFIPSSKRTKHLIFNPFQKGEIRLAPQFKFIKGSDKPPFKVIVQSETLNRYIDKVKAVYNVDKIVFKSIPEEILDTEQKYIMTIQYYPVDVNIEEVSAGVEWIKKYVSKDLDGNVVDSLLVYFTKA